MKTRKTKKIAKARKSPKAKGKRATVRSTRVVAGTGAPRGLSKMKFPPSKRDWFEGQHQIGLFVRFPNGTVLESTWGGTASSPQVVAAAMSLLNGGGAVPQPPEQLRATGKVIKLESAEPKVEPLAEPSPAPEVLAPMMSAEVARGPNGPAQVPTP